MNAVLIGIVVPVVTAVVTWQLVLHTLPSRLATLMEVAVAEQGEQGERGERGATGKSGRHEPLSTVFVVIIVASFVVVGIGLQAFLAHRADKADDLAKDRHDKAVEVCTKEWAANVVATINIGRDLNQDLQDAETARDNAVDEIILDVVDLTAHRGQEATPEQTADFQKDLASFVAAKNNLVAVQTNVTEARDNNPYPVLQLTCDAGQKAAAEVTE